MQEDVLGSTSAISMEAALRSSERLAKVGRFAEAKQTLTDALRQRFLSFGDVASEAAMPSLIDLLAIEKLADLIILFGQAAAADDLLLSVKTWYERAGNLYFSDYVSVKRIHIALGRGLLGDALETLREMEPSLGDIESIEISERGLAVWEGRVRWAKTRTNDRLLLLTRLYLEMGKVLTALGQYTDSLTILKRGLRHATSTPPEMIGSVVFHLKLATAAALLERGDLSEAESAFLELQPQLDEQHHPGLFVKTLEGMGKLELLTGKFGAALGRFRKALSVCSLHGFEVGEIASCLNLAHVLISLNQTLAAQEILRFVQTKAACDDASVMRASFLLQIAQARRTSTATGVQVSPVIEMWGYSEPRGEVLADLPSGELQDIEPCINFLAFFEDRVLGFLWRLSHRDTIEASRYLAQLKDKDLFLASDSRLIHLKLQALEAMLAYYQNDFEKAEVLLQKMRPRFSELGLKPELWQAQRLLSWCWKNLGRSESEQEALATDTQQLLTEMTDSLDPAERAIFLLNKWTADEEYIVSEINHLVRLKADLVQKPLIHRMKLRWQMWKRLHALLNHIDRYKDALARRAVEKPRNGGKSPAPSLWQRLLGHPRQRATLIFLVLPDRVFIACSGWMSLDFDVSLTTRIEVRELVRACHEPVQELMDDCRGLGAPSHIAVKTVANKANAVEDRLKAISERLAQALQFPKILNGLPKRIRALTIVPDDSLHGFPFAVLSYNGKYLIEDFTLSVVFESRSRKPQQAGKPRDVALTVGVSQAVGEYPPLPGAVEEINHVSDWLSRCGVQERRLSDSGEGENHAAKARVVRLLNEARFFHVACHGDFMADAPDKSGIVLATANGNLEMLSLRELSAMDLTGLRHTTLSSCWSADNYVLPGRWIVSLPETLLRAGSESVLGCLWLVSDNVAVALMKRFYEYVEIYPRDEALRCAQLDCLHKRLHLTDTDSSNPVFWAGYNLYGSHKNLRL